MIPILAAGFFGIEHFSPPWDVIYLPLFNLLVLAYRLLFNDFALAIIVFTVVIRTILAPLFAAQIRQQKEMQRMQPLIREVQRKHKGNAQKIQQEQMALYREHGVNPLGGCLPLLVQMPILIILYQALIRASNVVTLTSDQVKDAAFTQLKNTLHGISAIPGSTTQFTAPVSGPCNLPQFDGGAYTHFLPLNCQLLDALHLPSGIQTVSSWLVNPFTGMHLNLAQPDHVFALVIPGTAFGISILAVIAGLLQFVQVKMTAPPGNPDDATSSATSTMTYLFPLLTVFWGGIFASGLILYWVVYTGYLVTHQFLIMGWGNLFPIFGWSPRWASPATGISAGARRPNPGSRPPNSSTLPSDDPPTSPHSSQSAQGQGAAPQRAGPPQRPAERRPGGKKKRGRRR